MAAKDVDEPAIWRGRGRHQACSPGSCWSGLIFGGLNSFARTARTSGGRAWVQADDRYRPWFGRQSGASDRCRDEPVVATTAPKDKWGFAGDCDELIRERS